MDTTLPPDLSGLFEILFWSHTIPRCGMKRGMTHPTQFPFWSPMLINERPRILVGNRHPFLPSGCARARLVRECNHGCDSLPGLSIDCWMPATTLRPIDDLRVFDGNSSHAHSISPPCAAASRQRKTSSHEEVERVLDVSHAQLGFAVCNRVPSKNR